MVQSRATQLGIFVGGSVVGILLANMLNRQQPAPVPVPVQQPRPQPPPMVPTRPAPVPVPVPVPAPPAPKPAPVPPTPARVQPTNDDISSILQQLGFPGPISDTRAHEAYVSNFNRQLRNPNWVFEHLTRDNLKAPHSGGSKGSDNEPDRSHSTFKEDNSIPGMFRALLKDYFKSGYDRGHLVPAADAKRSQTAMDETFLLTNISPQVGTGFNRDYWSHFELFTRRLTKTFDDVYVFTGPLYLPKKDLATGKWKVEYEVIGNPANVAVPTHFYKVILVKDATTGRYAVGGFVLPNTPIPGDAPLESFSMPISAIEKSAGLVFFDKLPIIHLPDQVTPLCQATKCSLTESRAYIEAIKKRKALAGPP
ncbi:nuclease [Dimargaris verticillata]|uniref:Endonuclease n=1 Tax=Dimargaris verticillata TaxID=2761393 RepID=A0A9W8B572_9FUNG|nr:nuclease [Dimargaris verticillata]